MMLTETYARPEGKAKPLAVRMSATGLLVAAILALLPFIWIEIPAPFWLALLPLIALRLWFARWLRKWIGGFTGDCLGALQQLSELTFLLGVLALSLFICSPPPAGRPPPVSAMASSTFPWPTPSPRRRGRSVKRWPTSFQRAYRRSGAARACAAAASPKPWTLRSGSTRVCES